MIRSLSALAAITTIAGLIVACDRNDASTTTTTSALYDAGVIAPRGVQVDNGTAVAAPITGQPEQLNNGMNGAAPSGASLGARYGTPGAPLPRADSPDSPATGYGTSAQGANPGTMNTPGSMNANSMNNNGALNGNGAMNNVPGGSNVGAVNNGNSAGSMNGTRPMNQLGSSSTPYRAPNGATDSPNGPNPTPPNSVP